MLQVAILRHGAPEVLAVREVPTPVPGPDEILIDSEAIGVNFAETLARRGLYPGAPKMPYVPGFEVAGRVQAVGPGEAAARFRPGDRVLALLLKGGYSSPALVPASSVFAIPEGMTSEVAAALPVQALTAWYALFETGTVRPGDRVLVHAAAGGVGSMAVQLALGAGAVVFGTAGSDEKVKALAAAGVHHPINYRTTDYVAEIRRLTQGKGLDVVLDSLGGAHIGRGMSLLRAGGRVASYGYSGQSGGLLPMYLGFITMKTLRTAYLLRDSLGFHGVNMVLLAGHPDRLRFRIDDVLGAWGKGILKPVIGGRFRLAEASKAHAALESRRTMGKLLLIP